MSSLTITHIEDGHTANHWVLIALSDGYSFRCPKRLARDYLQGLAVDGYSTGEQFQQSLQSEFIEYAKQKMFDLLSRSDYTVSQITKKLGQEGLEDAIISEVVQYGTELGILNDSRYMHDFIETRYKRGYGSRYIIEKLAIKGIAPKDAEQHLSTDEYDFVESGYHWVISHSNSSQSLDSAARKKLLGKLLYRGFTYNEISSIFNKIGSDSENDSGPSYLD